jgi:hypothetical protein
MSLTATGIDAEDATGLPEELTERAERRPRGRTTTTTPTNPTTKPPAPCAGHEPSRPSPLPAQHTSTPTFDSALVCVTSPLSGDAGK